MFLSAQKCFSVHKYISQCTNVGTTEDGMQAWLRCFPALTSASSVRHAYLIRWSFRMFCPGCGAGIMPTYSFCPSCGGRLKPTTNGENVDNSRKRSSCPAASGSSMTFKQFASMKSDERKSHFKVFRNYFKKNAPTEVTINVSLMEYEDDSEDLKPVRGSSLPLKISTMETYKELLDAAINKRGAFDRTFRKERGYVLAYQDTRIARYVPGTKEKFVLKKYKDWLGKSYSRITLHLSPTSKEEDESLMEQACVDVGDTDWSDGFDCSDIGDTCT